MTDTDNTPLTLAQIIECADGPGNDVPLVWIGDDGEVFTPGHDVDVDAFIRAVGVEADPPVEEDVERLWVIATPHRGECDLVGECSCQVDYSWWRAFVDESTPGAIAVTAVRS